MRIALLAFGLLCCLIGAEFLIVDKIVLHGPAPGSAEPDEREAAGEEPGRVIDLPDSGGFALVAVGAASIMLFAALGRKRDH